jgi:uncharacterized membrane protein
MEPRKSFEPSEALRAALFFGGLWGIAEATLGYLLHLLPMVAPFPSIAGALLFPVGFCFMSAAFLTTGRASSILLSAAVAAAVKLASLILPMVTFPFVRNPALAILLEGLTTFVVVGLLGLRRDRLLVPKVLGLSVTWRALYLAVLVLLGIRGGILSKGTGAILEFLLLESAISGVLIWIIVSGSLVERMLPGAGRAPRLRTAGIALACAGAIGAEMIFRIL